MKLKLVIFDMDGLLVDTEIHYKNGWIIAADKLGVQLSRETVNSWIGQSIDYTNSYLEKLTGSYKKVQEIRNLRELYFYEMLNSSKVCLKKGAVNILSFLKEKNIKIALASSTVSKRGNDILNTLKIEKFFDIKVFGNDVKNVKPSPDVYNLAFEKSEIISKDDVLVIEDSIIGANAANNANFATIIVPDISFHKAPFNKVPDSVISQQKDLDEVLSFIKKQFI